MIGGFRVISLMLLFLCINSARAICQEIDSTKIKLSEVAREIMTNAGYCALITLDEEGHPRARVMDPFIPENDFTVWFGTNPKSRKITQIKRDPRVTLYYQAIDTSGYVTISGTAQIIDEQQKKVKYWKPKWKDFYPDYPKGYLLIKVTPIRIEILSTTHNILGDIITWEPPNLIIDSEK